MITGKGKLVQCIEDIEIIQQLSKRKKQILNFIKDIYYTALLEDKIVLIDREHKSIILPKEIYNKHFKLVS